MKTYALNYAGLEESANKEPRFIVQVSWDADDTDYTYLTSSTDAQVPSTSPVVDTIHNSVLNISGQTQKINPNIATSTIGSVTITLSDVTSSDSPPLTTQVTTRMNTKLDAGDGLRGKVIRVYVGYKNIPFTEYDLRLTYIIDSVSYRDGIYKIAASDIQRESRHKVFTPDETNLNASISINDLIIPVTTIDTALFPLLTHGAEWSVRPDETVTYIKLEDEVICVNTQPQFSTTDDWHMVAIERGALNTRAVAHDVDDDTTDNRKPKITEHIYLEGAAPKVIYAILTGQLLNGASPEDTLPEHWNLGIDPAFVRLTDFQSLGVDFWDTTDDSGRFVRIENPKAQDGKKYIEKEMLLWMGAFMPIYSTGELGIRKLAGVLSDASYLAVLDKYNIKSYSDLTHDMRSVINDIRVSWNWVDGKQEYTKENLFIDQPSITKHGCADSKVFKFKAVHTGLHTDEDLLTYFDVLRDRYSGPPLLLSLNMLPSMSRMEVGDTVYVELDQIRDFNTGTTLARTFEIQQVTTNWATGALSFKLFGSSQAAGELIRTTLASVLLDSFYTSLGTELSTVLTISAGTVTANGTLTGSATDIDSGVFYFDGDLTIGAGVTVTVNENVQLRIKGDLLINGNIDGLGNGATAGAATSQFADASTSDVVNTSLASYDPAKEIDFDKGEQGYFGNTVPAGALRAIGFSGASALGDCDYISTSINALLSPLAAFAFLNDNVGAPSGGTVDVVPFFQLTNDQQTNTLKGYPADLRGNSGGGGVPFMRYRKHSGVPAFTRYILSNGGAGGDGGAGLLIVSRGMAFGVNGEIDLSGGDSAAGAVATHAGTGKEFYAGSGAPGAPGALLILLDGQVTNPDVTASKFIANYGDAVHAGSTTPLSLMNGDGGIDSVLEYVNGWQTEYVILTDCLFWGSSVWPYTKGVYQGPPGTAVENVSKLDAAHRIQYIPQDETPAFEAQDEAIFEPPGVLGYAEINRIQKATPAANDYFGNSSAILDTGSRIVIGSAESAVTGTIGNIEILRNVDNIEREQTIAGTVSAWNFGKIVDIDNDGSRVFATEHNATVAATATAGRVNVYSRAGVTWTLEQAVSMPTPVNGDLFGDWAGWNDVADKMLVKSNKTGGIHVDYFDRSGTVWTWRSALTLPSALRALVAMSRGGEWALASNHLATVDAITGVGEIDVYQRSGTTWTSVKTLSPRVEIDNNWGQGGMALSYDGSVIAIAGFETIGFVAVYFREGTVYKLLQIINSPNPSVSTFGTDIRMSDDGLNMLVQDENREENFIFKRSNKAQAFSVFQELPYIDTSSFTTGQLNALSPSGQLMVIGDVHSDINATKAGAVHIWRNIGT